MKFQILRFVAEQGIVTVDNIKNKFNCKKESVRVIMSQLGISHYKYGDIQHGLWFIGDQKLFGLLRT
ncbi:MAG: hypothetical protein KJ736_08010, partial [Candidatus Omnitrophica bacterium]|nr:hypothetical protein [Candidatus Omnitrophota bacterium]